MPKILRASFVVAVLLLSRQADAASITLSGNSTFTVDWLNTTTSPSISGSADFAVTGWTGTGFDLAITAVRNTMPVTPDINARFISFAFGLTPDATFSNLVDGAVFQWKIDDKFPGGFNGQVDLCGFSGPNCNGGGTGGLGQGESTAPGDIMSVHVTGNFGSGVTFSPIAAKFQSNQSAQAFDGCVRGAEDCPVGVFEDPLAAPEPASVILLGSGLAFVLLRRRRKS